MSPGRDVQPDFEDLLACFNTHGVDYVIVGSEAVAVHGAPRYSLDFDVAIAPTVANARRVFAALAQFGFGEGLQGHAPEQWIEDKQILQLGVKPNQIHILLELTGLSYEEAVRDPVAATYGRTPVRYLGYDALLQNKRAAGRVKDLADVEALERARHGRSRKPSHAPGDEA